MKLDLTSLEKAVSQLEGSLDMYNSELAESVPDTKKYFRSATIQAFEYTYELAFKMVKRRIAASLGNPKEVNDMTFNDMIRTAYGKNIVKSDVSVWCEYRKKRGTASHTYDEDKAQKVFESAVHFLDEARYILYRLQELNE